MAQSACQGILDGLVSFGMRLTSALKEKARLLIPAGRNPKDLAPPLERLTLLIARIMAFAAQVQHAAKAQPSAAEPKAEAKGVGKSGVFEREFESHFETDGFEFDEDDEDLFDREDLFDDFREPRSRRRAKALDEDAFGKTVAGFWQELLAIAAVLGDHPLVREIEAAAAEAGVRRPPPPDTPHRLTSDQGDLPSRPPRAASSRAPP